MSDNVYPFLDTLNDKHIEVFDYGPSSTQQKLSRSPFYVITYEFIEFCYCPSPDFGTSIVFCFTKNNRITRHILMKNSKINTVVLNGDFIPIIRDVAITPLNDVLIHIKPNTPLYNDFFSLINFINS